MSKRFYFPTKFIKMNPQFLSFLFESNSKKIRELKFKTPTTFDREENLIGLEWIPIEISFKDPLLEMLMYFGVGCVSFFIYFMVKKWNRERTLKNNSYFYKN
jgi:hypothetical protein